MTCATHHAMLPAAANIATTARLLAAGRLPRQASWFSARTGGQPRWQQQQQQRGRLLCSASTTAPPGLAAAPWTGSPEELQALEQLRAGMAVSAKHAVPDDETLVWFLRDRKFDPVEAQRKLESMLDWRTGLRLHTLQYNEIAQEDALGKAYVHDHADLAGRPALVIRVARHRIGEFPPEASQRLCAYYVERALEALPPADSGGAESVLGVFDLRGFGPANADLGFAKFIVDCFFTYYPKRVSQVLFVDAPWVFKPTYELIKPLLRKYSALVRFVSTDQLLKEYFTAETAPPDFLKK